ncbi:hypothetical protein GE09DRAFT_1109797 [Coniochaeta sp. 2T2.1]|nr:hypothetical protein GE09DRAFT_1109797 [Coniochaeta sp. 2T2.1]
MDLFCFLLFSAVSSLFQDDSFPLPSSSCPVRFAWSSHPQPNHFLFAHRLTPYITEPGRHTLCPVFHPLRRGCLSTDSYQGPVEVIASFVLKLSGSCLLFSNRKSQT